MILSLETSTPVCSVALHQGGKLVAEVNLHQSQSHSSKLSLIIEQMLDMVGCNSFSLTGIAVAKGPGSYTGLRIGTSTAKGLCFALDIPLLAINTLEALALQVAQLQHDDALLLCPMLDARRMEVYCAIYQQNLTEIMPTEAKIIEANSFADVLENQKVLFFGDGADKCRPALSVHKNAYFLADIYPKAQAIGQLAFDKFEKKQFEDLAYFEPFYLKDFVNNTKIKAK